MVRWLLILCMALVSITSHAQNTKENQDDFEGFRAGIHEDFNKFRDEINREFIEFVRNPWKEFESVAPVPKPKQEPVPPVVVPREDKDSVPVKSTPIEIDTIIKPSPITPQPKPIEPIPENDLADEHMVSVSLFGTAVSDSIRIRNIASSRFQRRELQMHSRYWRQRNMTTLLLIV